MKTCRSCFFCVPCYRGTKGHFKKGSCYQSNRHVCADMTACQLYEERTKTMPVKSNKEKRNKYRDKDNNLIWGMTLSEVVDKPLTILEKREYTWGLYNGLAVKVRSPEGKLGIVEITAEIPILALCDPKFPKLPLDATFVQKMSKNKRRYFTLDYAGMEKKSEDPDDAQAPLWF